jgi:hypothetical protein
MDDLAFNIKLLTSCNIHKPLILSQVESFQHGCDKETLAPREKYMIIKYNVLKLNLVTKVQTSVISK